MRAILRAVGLTLVAVSAAGAQERRDSISNRDARALPREVAREVTDLFNAPGTVRSTGSLEIAADKEISGDVAVLNGPLTVAGHITGRVVAVNADVVLKPSARIDGDILVVGGVLEGKETAYVGGEIRIYREVLYYRQEGDRIVAERRSDTDEDERWWRRERRNRSHAWSEFRIASAHTYNRVEGLPIYLGPSVRERTSWGTARLDAYGVVRTANNFTWDSQNLGHSVKGDLRWGRRGGLGMSGRLYDVVESVEPWQLSDTEVGLASFFLHRDYRDYFDRHGGSATLSLFAADAADLGLTLSDERWGARDERDPWTLFRNKQNWRPNPLLDEGRFHVATARLHVDTRNDENNPWSGWYLLAEVERGRGLVERVGPTSPGVRTYATGRTGYQRGFLDLRRYNRLSPDAQLNLRVVVGGWLSGDPLPLQRRFSVGGPGTIPGFDFRETGIDPDVGACSPNPSLAPAGFPAECDRMALAQAEYRGDIHVHVFNDNNSDWWPHPHMDNDATWVLFADAGRGWLVDSPLTGLGYARGDLPALGTFRTDIGLGLDFGGFGAYVAKAVSKSDEPANFLIRVKKRF
jgi:hypothetical protein